MKHPTTIYVNHFHLSMTPAGLRIVFGERTDPDKDPAPRAAVLTSLADAIGLGQALASLGQTSPTVNGGARAAAPDPEPTPTPTARNPNQEPAAPTPQAPTARNPRPRAGRRH